MTTTPATTRPCDASHNYNGGVGCEFDADHAGMHRHGEHDRRVVYWSTPFDLATRAELVVEMALLERLGELRPRLGVARWNPGLLEREPEFVPPVDARLRAATTARIQARLELILETLYGPDALESVPEARARIAAELQALEDQIADDGWDGPRARPATARRATVGAPRPARSKR